MTVNEIYSKTKALMFEKPSSTIYDNYLIANLNQVLRELFEENNMCRMFNDKPPLSSVPYVSATSDDIDYEDEYINNVLPLGLACYFMIDDDLNKYSIFNARYNNARVFALKIVNKDKVEELSNASVE